MGGLRRWAQENRTSNLTALAYGRQSRVSISFLPDSAAIRTEVDSDLRAVATAFGADYGVTTADDGTIEVIHTGSLYAVNSSGELLLSWPFGVPSSDIAKDLEILLDRERI